MYDDGEKIHVTEFTVLCLVLFGTFYHCFQIAQIGYSAILGDRLQSIGGVEERFGEFTKQRQVLGYFAAPGRSRAQHP